MTFETSYAAEVLDQCYLPAHRLPVDHRHHHYDIRLEDDYDKRRRRNEHLILTQSNHLRLVTTMTIRHHLYQHHLIHHQTSNLAHLSLTVTYHLHQT